MFMRGGARRLVHVRVVRRIVALGAATAASRHARVGPVVWHRRARGLTASAAAERLPWKGLRFGAAPMLIGLDLAWSLSSSSPPCPVRQSYRRPHGGA